MIRSLKNTRFKHAGRVTILTIIIVLFTLSRSHAQDAFELVRLATYWDTPGYVTDISANDRHMIVYDTVGEQARLVEIATGHILTEQPRNDALYFSPDGRYASVYDVASGNTQIVDLERKVVTYEAPVGRILIRFSPDSQYGVAGFSDPEQRNYHAQVIRVETGDVLIDVPGWNEQLSPDGRFIAVTDPLTQTAAVYDVNSGEIVLEWPLTSPTEEQVSASITFSPDSKLLVIYQFHNNTGFVFDTESWQQRYEIVGHPGFSADSQYILSNRHAGYSHVYLYEAATGRLLDEVGGDMYFSVDSKLLFRRQASAPGDRAGTVQVIDLSSDQTLLEVRSEGYDSIGVGVEASNTLVRVYKQILDINFIPTTTFIDLSCGDMVIEVTGRAVLIDRELGLMLVGNLDRQKQPGQHLVDWDTGETLLVDRFMEASPAGRYIVASNGLFVDVCGVPEDRLETMPGPRPDSGIGSMEAGDISIYPTPDAAEPLIENTLNPLIFYVLGQTADGEWLYGTGQLNERREGWLRAEQLTVVEPWDDVPVLDPADPLQNLYETATKPNIP